MWAHAEVLPTGVLGTWRAAVHLLRSPSLRTAGSSCYLLAPISAPMSRMNASEGRRSLLDPTCRLGTQLPLAPVIGHSPIVHAASSALLPLGSRPCHAAPSVPPTPAAPPPLVSIIQGAGRTLSVCVVGPRQHATSHKVGGRGRHVPDGLPLLVCQRLARVGQARLLVRAPELGQGLGHRGPACGGWTGGSRASSLPEWGRAGAARHVQRAGVAEDVGRSATEACTLEARGTGLAARREGRHIKAQRGAVAARAALGQGRAARALT